MRDLARARDDAREDLQRCRHRLGKLLLRRGLHYAGRDWTRAHRQWIDGLAWTHAERAVVDDYRLAIDHTEARLRELDARLTRFAAEGTVQEPVGWLRCFRGIDTLTAMLILAELHDVRRFAAAPALMAYLGLVPGEDSTGEKQRRDSSRARATRWSGGCWWKQRGTIDIGRALAWRSPASTRDSPAVSLRSRTGRSSDCAGASARWRRSINRPRRSPSRSRANWRAFCGPRCNRPRRQRTDGGGGAETARPGNGPRRRRMIRGTMVEDRRVRHAIRTDVPIRDFRLHDLPTNHGHVCAAAGDRGNHRISA